MGPTNAKASHSTIETIYKGLMNKIGAGQVKIVQEARTCEKVLERGIQNGYHTAKVEWIKDAPIPKEELDEVKTLHENVYNEAKAWFSNLPLIPRRRITNMFSTMPSCDVEQLSLSQGPTWLWWLVSVCPMPEHVQLEFISIPCVKSRLEKLQQLIRALEAFT